MKNLKAKKSNMASTKKMMSDSSEIAVSPFESGSSMIFLMETEDAYLMQVDLPSVQMPIGEIISKNHELTVTTGDRAISSAKNSSPKNKVKNILPNILSLHTLGGKIKSFYQEGALYILLPKGQGGVSPAVLTGAF